MLAELKESKTPVQSVGEASKTGSKWKKNIGEGTKHIRNGIRPDMESGLFTFTLRLFLLKLCKINWRCQRF